MTTSPSSPSSLILSHLNREVTGRFRPAFPTSLARSMRKVAVVRHRGCVNCANFDDSGTLLATGSDDLVVNIVSSNSFLHDDAVYHKVSRETRHTHNIFHVEFSKHATGPDLQFASCGADGVVLLHHLERPEAEEEIKAYDSMVNQFRFAPRAPLIYSATYSGMSVRDRGGLVDMHDLRLPPTSRTSRLYSNPSTHGNVKALDIDPLDDNHLAVGVGTQIVVLDTRMAGETERISDTPPPSNIISKIGLKSIERREVDFRNRYRFYPPGTNDFSAIRFPSRTDGMKHLDFLHDTRSYLDPHEVEGVPMELSISSLCFSRIRPGEVLVSYQNDSIYRLDLTKNGGAVLGAYHGSINAKTFLKRSTYFGPDEGYILGGGDDGNAWMWEKRGGEVVFAKPADAYSGGGEEELGVCNGVVGHPDRAVFVSYGLEGTAKIWAPRLGNGREGKRRGRRRLANGGNEDDEDEDEEEEEEEEDDVDAEEMRFDQYLKNFKGNRKVGHPPRQLFPGEDDDDDDDDDGGGQPTTNANDDNHDGDDDEEEMEEEEDEEEEDANDSDNANPFNQRRLMRLLQERYTRGRARRRKYAKIHRTLDEYIASSLQANLLRGVPNATQDIYLWAVAWFFVEASKSCWLARERSRKRRGWCKFPFPRGSVVAEHEAAVAELAISRGVRDASRPTWPAPEIDVKSTTLPLEAALARMRYYAFWVSRGVRAAREYRETGNEVFHEAQEAEAAGKRVQARELYIAARRFYESGVVAAESARMFSLNVPETVTAIVEKTKPELRVHPDFLSPPRNSSSTSEPWRTELAILMKLHGAESDMTSITTGFKEADEEVKLNELNAAMCGIKQKRWAYAECLTEHVLSILDPDNVKALYRRAIAAQGRGDLASALTHLERAKRVQGGDTPIVRAELAKVQRAIAAQLRRR